MHHPSRPLEQILCREARIGHNVVKENAAGVHAFAMPIGQHHRFQNVFNGLVLFVCLLFGCGLVVVFERLFHHPLVFFLGLLGREIFAVLLQSAFDGDAVDKELVVNFGCGLFRIAPAVGLNQVIGDAAVEALALGGELVLVGDSPLKEFGGIGQRRVGSWCGGLRGDRRS